MAVLFFIKKLTNIKSGDILRYGQEKNNFSYERT